MGVTINDGWLTGYLVDDRGGKHVVTQHRQTPTGAQNGSPVNLVLHTTETDGLIDTLKYPSNFQCGEGRIIQHIQLGHSGDAVYAYDRDNIGIEMVGRSKLTKWLPAEPTIGPTIALVAWLHSEGLIKSGLKRPYPYGVVLDQMPAAVPTYYRRRDPKAQVGVYGHVDLSGGNQHWDPGSFNYPEFFGRVSATLQGGGDDEMAYKDFQRGWKSFVQGDALPDGTDDDFFFGYTAARFAARNPEPAVGQPADPHAHTVKVLGKTFTTSEA